MCFNKIFYRKVEKIEQNSVIGDEKIEQNANLRDEKIEQNANLRDEKKQIANNGLQN